ncbi:555_t:CDS:1, partial [Funneliformis mosseae]
YEEESYEEIYATLRVRVISCTINRRDAKEKSKKISESQQEIRLRNRNVCRPISLNILIDMQEGISIPKVKKSQRKILYTLFAVDQLASNNIAEEIFNFLLSAKLRQ